jgi:hypothetical protein
MPSSMQSGKRYRLRADNDRRFVDGYFLEPRIRRSRYTFSQMDCLGMYPAMAFTNRREGCMDFVSRSGTVNS